MHHHLRAVRSAILPACLLATALSSCASVSTALDDLHSRVVRLSRGAAQGAVHGALQELDTNAARQRVLASIDSMLGVYRETLVGASFDTSIAHARQALLKDLDAELMKISEPIAGKPMRDRLVRILDDLLTTARPQLTGLRDDLLGVGTESRIDSIVAAASRSLRRELLGDSTAMFVTELRDTLVGPTTQEAVATMIARARAEYEAAIGSTGSTLSGTATTIIVVLALAVVGVISWAYLLRKGKVEKERMLDIVTQQIHDIDDRQAYDALTTRIRSKARAAKLDKALDTFLQEKGRIGDDAWMPRQVREPAEPVAAAGGGPNVFEGRQ